MNDAKEVNVVVFEHVTRRSKERHFSSLRSLGDNIESLSEQIENLTHTRDVLMLDAFREVERVEKNFAAFIVERLGTRRRAARWLIGRSPELGEQSGYQAIAAGDLDSVWELISPR